MVYYQAFSPLIQLNPAISFSLSVCKNWSLYDLDIKVKCRHGVLRGAVYVEQREEVEVRLLVEGVEWLFVWPIILISMVNWCCSMLLVITSFKSAQVLLCLYCLSVF